jgi:hypothetical protein
MAEVARSVSEWHRRMTAEKLNQSGQPVDMTKFPIGTRVFFYKPPSKQEADNKGRRAKQIDHYVGPAKVTKHIGTRSVQLEMEKTNGRSITYKRDIGMLLLKKPRVGDDDPTIPLRPVISTQSHSDTLWNAAPLQVGEHIIFKDGPLATTWYCAEISRIERNWTEVNYYTTVTPALDNYGIAGRIKASKVERSHLLKNMGAEEQRWIPNNHGT